MKTYLDGDVVYIVIDGYIVVFWLLNAKWIAVIEDIPDGIEATARRTAELLNLHHKNPAVQLWLSSGGYGGMTLEEFLEAAG